MNFLTYILLLFTLSCTTHFSAFAQSKFIAKKLAAKDLHIVAHRGAHQQHPENSIASIKAAIKLGVTVVELDVRSTKDGVLILMHDKTLDRTTTGTGEVYNYTYAEIQTLRLRESPHGAPTSIRIPTLSEALKASKNKIIVDIDFKEERKEYIRTAVADIQQQGMEEQVLFFLYDHTDMSSLNQLDPKITPFPRARTIADVSQIVESGLTSIIHIDDTFMDVAYLNSLKDQGVFLWQNTLGEIDDLAELEGTSIYKSFLKSYPYVKLIQTDHPDLWSKAAH